ncbi:hypothetical protein B5P44_17430 [Mycobacterium sp. CBMA 213]|nr:hypothetical protein [Mycolicibacterium sp. CBMA 213]
MILEASLVFADRVLRGSSAQDVCSRRRVRSGRCVRRYQHLENRNDDSFLKYWYCVQHDDGLWYLHNTDSPTERIG